MELQLQPEPELGKVQRPDEMRALKKEQAPSVDTVCARLAGELQLQPEPEPDRTPSADMVRAVPAGELVRRGKMPVAADVGCAEPLALGELPSAREASARLAAARKMGFEAEERVRGLLNELSTAVTHPPEHHAGLLRALREAEEESKLRALEVELAYMEAQRAVTCLMMEQKNLVIREAMEVRQALVSMTSSSLGCVLNQQSFSEQDNPALGAGNREAGEMKAHLEQALGAFMASFMQGGDGSSSSQGDSASSSRAHFDDAGGDAAQ